MAIVEMNRLSIIALNNDKQQILECLMKMGICEVVCDNEKLSSDEWAELIVKDGEAEALSILENDIEKLKFTLDYFAKYDNRKKGLFETKRNVTELELNEVISNEDNLRSIINAVKQYDDNLSSLKSLVNKKLNLIASLEPWRALDIPLGFTSTKNTTTVIGVVPAIWDADEIIINLKEQVNEIHVEVLNKDREQNYLLIIYHNSVEEEAMKVLKKYGFSKVNFKELEGTITESINDALATIDSTQKLYSEVEANIAALADEKTSLEVYYDYLIFQRDRIKALSGLMKTDKTFMLEGWIPAKLSEQVKSILTEKWSAVVSITEPKEDEEYPILLSNKGMGESVEPITKMYSLPNSKEIDPNRITAPFFILFFGLMLSDGGYGLIMVIASAFLLWKLNFEDNGQKKFLTLMLYCGVSTMFWGLLFGGWFGIAALAKYGVWFNPVEDPEEMLKWSLVFGIIHIYVGLGVRAANFFLKKKYMDIIFDVLTWYVFFTGFVLFVLPYAPKVDAEAVGGLVVIGKYLLVIGAALIILTQGRTQKNIVMKVVSGFSGLYDLVGFMSDVLSYSRLLALGLATSVIAGIVNEMGALGGLDNIFGILIFIVVLLVGHAFNFAINALGAYVHSSRLQYIEFFGKFYKGGGTSFDPLKVNTKYINLK